MHQVSLSEFQTAVESLELISLRTKEDVRKKYLKLSKKYHPDMEGGSTEKFQEIREAYEILVGYMDNFRFVFSDEEFKQQNPLLVNTDYYVLEEKKDTEN
ncbi:MAG: Heat shock protein DnaJ-like [uncultured Sulfurovum sp.]|uniref:Heat shock protein DnaJ-like n=1 Tax=uncultured Sulfurovum sp. TaxID=269237 RepID=A0A6S6TWH5_9BACT|nr:MAG: Heat shock protein DnaJ-like [uncultured Sulfurovum sp.]